MATLANRTMKTRSYYDTPTTHVRNNPTAAPLNRDLSGLVVIGAVLALTLLSGCASASRDAAYDEDHYNAVTGYPAVGSTPWHL